MRINRFIAMATGISRRAADKLIESGKVAVNGETTATGREVIDADTVFLDGTRLTLPETSTSIILNKPAGYVCSRDGQGSRTIYDLLPSELHRLKPVGRLDKDSSGLLLMTDDGELAHRLTHPSFQKMKRYEITLDKPLAQADKEKIENGVMLEDGISRLSLRSRKQGAGSKENRNDTATETHTSYSILHTPAYEVRMSEGRNRQIRRTFAALGYNVTKLHRTHFGDYTLQGLEPGKHRVV